MNRRFTGSPQSEDVLAAVHQVVAQTKAVEEEVQGTEVLVKRSAAEKDALLQDHARLQSDLSDVMSKISVLEHENATMRAQALKRAQRQIKGLDARNILDGDMMTKAGTQRKCTALSHGVALV